MTPPTDHEIDFLPAAPPPTAPSITDPIAAIKRIGAIDTRKKSLDTELDALKEEREQLEEIVKRHFEAVGIQNIRVDGRTFYLEGTIWAKLKNAEGDRTAACGALKAAGLPEFVQENFNTNKVSAYLRELAVDRKDDLEAGKVTLNELLPKELQLVFEASEVFKIRSRKA